MAISKTRIERTILFVFLLAILVVVSVAVYNLISRSETRRDLNRDLNLVIITIDTVRADFLGIYGYPHIVSPNLDQLAEHAIIFNRAFSTAPRTSPSHASIFTSQLPSEHSVIFNGIDMPGKIDKSLPVLAEHLLDAGFSTGAVVSAPPVGRRHGFSRGFRYFHEVFDKTYVEVKGKRYKLDDGGRGDLVSASADRWLNVHKDERFFLWAHYFDAHLPYHCEMSIYKELGMEHKYVPHSVARKMPADELCRYYRADVYEMDKNVGMLIESLRDLDLMSNTVIAVVADHGEYLHEHGLLAHTLLYDEVLHVPMFIRLPDIKNPKRYESVISTIDLAPTLLEILGVEHLPGAKGRNLLDGGEESPSVPVFAEWWWHKPFLGKSASKPSDVIVCVQLGNYKLIRDRLFHDYSKLFNLKDDPDEENNLFSSDHEMRDKLENILQERYGGKLDMDPSNIKQISLDRNTVKMLKELGYMQ